MFKCSGKKKEEKSVYALISCVKLCWRQVTAHMRFTISLCQGPLDLWNYITATLWCGVACELNLKRSATYYYRKPYRNL